MVLAAVSLILALWVARRGFWLPESPISDIHIGLEGWNGRGKMPGTQEEELDRPWGRNSVAPSDPSNPI